MIVELERVNDANREHAIGQLLASFGAMDRGTRTMTCHALAISPDQYEGALRSMSNEQLSLHYYDVEDNGDLAGAPIGETVN